MVKEEHNSIISHASVLYEMFPEALAFARTGNNYTASICGSDKYGGWLVRQGQFLPRVIIYIYGFELSSVYSILPGEVH
jgi:hypothetical protein